MTILSGTCDCTSTSIQHDREGECYVCHVAVKLELLLR